jgi:hypothetical protein
MRTRVLTGVAALAAAVAFAAPAGASQLITRNAIGATLAVNARGVALVSFRAGGRAWHVLAAGAINARAPSPTVPQVRFRLDYSGGWRWYRKVIWPHFRNACGAYTGPRLANLVAGCTAADGTWWALQKWQPDLPNLGFAPWTARQTSWNLQISHWTGPLATMELWRDWTYGGRFHEIFGRFTYRGQPVHGFRSTKTGAALDSYARLVHLDTHNSRYGKGWRRENSFLLHRTGVFCYGFYRFDPYHGGNVHPPGYRGGLRGPGVGDRYNVTVDGPGVTPLQMWEVPDLGDYDPSNQADVALENAMNKLLDSISGHDPACHH